MAAQTGINNAIHIQRETLDKILLSIKQYSYETGGIIGADGGIISAFQFDKTCGSNPFEYCPNVDFLNQVINEKWANGNIEFIGFVHSHLNNSEVSRQDIDYSRDILRTNKHLNYIILGIVDLSKKKHCIGWCKVDRRDVLSLQEYVL